MNPIPRLAQKSSELLIGITRRLDPYYRDEFDRLLRPPIERAAQYLLRRRLRDEGLAIAEEKPEPREQAVTKEIIDTMNAFLIREYKDTGKVAERAGNTKTYGLVKAFFTVNSELPKRLQVGVFKAGRSYPAYVRFGGPGPRVVPDIKDNGIPSIGVKLMEVPGKKLLDDEKHTVDFSGISAPTFTTPNIHENIKLQKLIARDIPAWYFLNPLDSHYLDMVMQGLYSRTHANPLELTYHSCVPYLYGREKGQDRAIKYALIPRLARKSRVGPITDNYLRQAMIDTLARGPIIFDFAIQFQKDPVTMPIENASVVWPEKDSPFIRVATLELPAQVFDYPAQDDFARNVTINPWHTLAVHRPLGNQNRARRTIYFATSRVRQEINGECHLEPTGEEDFTQALPTRATGAMTSAQSGYGTTRDAPPKDTLTHAE